MDKLLTITACAFALFIILAAANVEAGSPILDTMFGNESLVDANDPPVFIVHGTADPTVPTINSYNLMNRCTAVGLLYEFHPIQGAAHGPWSNFWVMWSTARRLSGIVPNFSSGISGCCPCIPSLQRPSRIITPLIWTVRWLRNTKPLAMCRSTCGFSIRKTTSPATTALPFCSSSVAAGMPGRPNNYSRNVSIWPSTAW